MDAIRIELSFDEAGKGRGPICLTLFGFDKWPRERKQQNATALRSFNNTDEGLMFLGS
jgi:hypothetical protein